MFHFNSHQAIKEAWQLYKHHLQVARLAISEDRGQYKALQPQTFYTNAKAITPQLKTYSIKPEYLTRGEAAINAVYRAYDRRDKKRDEARRAPNPVSKKKPNLTHWMRRYTHALSFAFEAQSKVPRNLGLKVKEEVA